MIKYNEANVYSLEDIQTGLKLSVTDQYVEFMKEGDDGFYFAYFSLQKFIDKIEGNIFSDRENEDSDILQIDLKDYADIFRNMLTNKV